MFAVQRVPSVSETGETFDRRARAGIAVCQGDRDRAGVVDSIERIDDRFFGDFPKPRTIPVLPP